MRLSAEQLSRLTKEEKLELFDLLEEKKRRDLAARPKFKPHPGQLKVIKSPALERYLFCGNGFGKTVTLVNEMHWAATGFNPITKKNSSVPAKICLIVDTPEKIEEIVTEYRNWHALADTQLHKKGKAYWSAISFDNGSTISILTHEVSDLKPEGSQWTHIFADEPPPQWLFTAIFRGGRIKGKPVRVLLAGTPVKAAWLRTEVYEQWKEGLTPWVECFEGHTEENKDNLEDGWIERFSSKLTEKEKGIRLRGEFFDLEGLALAHLYRPATHLVPRGTEWNPSNPCVVVFDPAPAKAHVAVLVGVDEDDNAVVLEEYKERANGRTFCKKVIGLGWFGRYRVMDIIYDSLGSSENLMGESYKAFGTILNEELREAGIGRARATTFDEKSDEDFVERIRDDLVVPEGGVPKLRFYSHCTGTISDIKNVQWYEDKTIKENRTKLDLRKKDFLSCVKYALATNLFFNKAAKRTYHRRKPVYGFSAQRNTASYMAPPPAATRPAARAKFGRRRRAQIDKDDD